MRLLVLLNAGDVDSSATNGLTFFSVSRHVGSNFAYCAARQGGDGKRGEFTRDNTARHDSAIPTCAPQERTDRTGPDRTGYSRLRQLS